MSVEDDDEQKENLWSKIISEVQNQSAKSLPVRKHLLVLGDTNSGKTQLITALQNANEAKSGVALEFHTLDIKDDSRDINSKLGVWVLDGDAYHSNLLKFALSEPSVAHTLAMIVVNMNEPWYVMDSLKQWSNVLDKHVARLKLAEEERQKLKFSLAWSFQQYNEEETISNLKSKDSKTSSSNSTTTASNNISATTNGSSTSSKSISTSKRLTIAFNPLHPDPQLDNNSSTMSENKAPTDNAVLNANFGIPIIVVANKTDCFERLEKEQKYEDEHFDFIQIHLRRFCLQYGAALIYTSVKDRRNCALLLQYIQHRIYGFPFNHAACVVDRDTIFVPAGWDSPAKINILSENLPKKFLSTYNDVISRPVVSLQALRSGASAGGGVGGGSGGPGGVGTVKNDAEVYIEDDQSFLSRMQTLLAKQPGAEGASHPPNQGDNVNNTAGMGRSISLLQEAPRRVGSGRAKGPVVGGGGAGQAGAANDGPLANFFNSLLNKRGGGVSPGGGGASATGAKLPRSDSSSSVRSLRDSVVQEVEPTTTNPPAESVNGE